MASGKAELSTRLRRVRDTLGLSQREFARDLGVTPAALAHWEIGRHEVPGPIVRLCTLYEEHLGIGVPIAETLDPPRSLLERSRIARTATTVYASAVWAAVRASSMRPGATSLEQRVRDAALTHYTRTLGQLKGLGMKLGQMLANVDALDPTLREQGRQPISAEALQAEPMSPRDLLEVFLDDFGQSPRELFARWSPTPTFAASIGQVHEAVLRSGEAVAVKVQYPRIVEMLRLDLSNIELLDRLYCVVTPGQRPGTFFEELRERIAEECDYVNEAANMRHFGAYFAGRQDIHIPNVHDDYSRRRVLTTDFVAGLSFEMFASSGSQAAKDRAGQAIWDFFYVPAGDTGVFHADPHAGNVRFREDGRVTFLDHGRVVRMSADFVNVWRQLVRAVCEKNRSRALELCSRLDFVGLDEALDNDDIYRLLVVNQVPWLCEGTFSFTTNFAHQSFRALAKARSRGHFNVPRDAVLWNQLLFGVFSLLVPLECSFEAREPILRIMYGPDERRPPPWSYADLDSVGLRS